MDSLLILLVMMVLVSVIFRVHPLKVFRYTVCLVAIPVVLALMILCMLAYMSYCRWTTGEWF
jgi:hypothetical protein